MIRVPMTAEHFQMIDPEPRFVGFKARMNVDFLLGNGHAAAFVEDTRVMALAGYVVRRPGVAWMWFLPAVGTEWLMLRVTRFFKRWVATLEPGIRVEATVLADFPEGNRWAQMLGMERETGEPMRLWDGQSDYHLYARVTGDQSRSI